MIEGMVQKKGKWQRKGSMKLTAGQLHRVNWELSKAQISFQRTPDRRLHLFTFFGHLGGILLSLVHAQCRWAVLWLRQWCLGAYLEVVLGSVQVCFGGDQWVSLTSKIWTEIQEGWISVTGACSWWCLYILRMRVEHQFAPFHMCVSVPTAPHSRPRCQNEKQNPFCMGTPPSGLAGSPSVRSVGCNLFLLEKGKAPIDNMPIGPVLAMCIFKIGG